MSKKNGKLKINVDRIRKSKWTYIIASVIFILLGLMLIFDPTTTGRKITFLIGGAIIAYGAFRLVSYFIKNKGEKSVSIDVIIGTVLCICGLAIIIFSNDVFRILSLFVGIFLIIDGMLKLQTAINARRAGISSWWAVLAAAAACIAFGCILIFVPALRNNASAMALGIALLVDGAQNLISAIYSDIILKKVPKENIDISNVTPGEPRRELHS